MTKHLTLLGHRMTRIFSILLFIGLAWGQDITIAVFEFENNGLEPFEVRQLSTRLESELVIVNKYKVVERSKIDEILKEQKLQLSGCVEECLIEIGNMVGAKKVIVGSVGIFGSDYTSSARLVNAETGEILKSANYDTQSLRDLLSFGMKYIAGNLCGLNIALPKNNLSKIVVKDKRQKRVEEKKLEEYAAKRHYSKTLDEILDEIEKKQLDETATNAAIQHSINREFEYDNTGYQVINKTTLFNRSSSGQRDAIKRLFVGANISLKGLNEYCNWKYGKPLKKLTYDEAASIIVQIQNPGGVNEIRKILDNLFSKK